MIAWCEHCKTFTAQDILYDEFEVGTLTPRDFPTKCCGCETERGLSPHAPDLNTSRPHIGDPCVNCGATITKVSINPCPGR